MAFPTASSETLSLEKKRRLFRLMLTSRQGDLREQRLLRQGQGWFHIAGMGHEGMAVLGALLRESDYAFPYYRDRALALAKGITTEDFARAFLAKRTSSSGGRQLTGHFSSHMHRIFSHASPVGAHALPAVGFGWGIQLDGRDDVVLLSLGEAATRQGEFYEAVCFAQEHRLPVIFVVEDNGLAISTHTEAGTPRTLQLLGNDRWVDVDGLDVDALQAAGSRAIERARGGEGPGYLWVRTARLHNHSSTDDQRLYLTEQEQAALEDRDPVARLRSDLLAAGEVDRETLEAEEADIAAEIRSIYEQVAREEDPKAEELVLHLEGAAPERTGQEDGPELPDPCRLVDAVNLTFRHALESREDVVFFGEDIEDPKGGVFNLTKGLSSDFPKRVVNAPVAEATICGLAVGLAAYGKRPVFELQFVDFIHPGWNQLFNNMANLRWRTFGDWRCPAILYAPCGAYLPGGAIWHSQSGESALAQIPGLRVRMPSRPHEAREAFQEALASDDPTIVLLPKHQFWTRQAATPSGRSAGILRAVRRHTGNSLTVVSWGNPLEIIDQVLADREDLSGALDVYDLVSLAPWDRETVADSVRRTGRLLVVQEDTPACSIGQRIIAELTGDRAVFAALVAPPRLIARAPVPIGFNPIYEYAALPDRPGIQAAVDALLAWSTPATNRPVVPPASAASAPSSLPMTDQPPSPAASSGRKQIKVPILGEGIREARLVALLKEPGEAVEPDEAVCEIETDKAVFPVESPCAGTWEVWAVDEGATVSVGDTLGSLVPDDPELADAERPSSSTAGVASEDSEGEGDANEVALRQAPGLPEGVLRQLPGIVPATITIQAAWSAIKEARRAAKEEAGSTGEAPSPSLMVAWSVTRAMRQHPVFASIVKGRQLLFDPDGFDLGVAVALDNDALETAAVRKAGTLDWPRFQEAYRAAVRAVRAGEVASKARVSLQLSSLGTFPVIHAVPIVVPPAVATLFVGNARLRPRESNDGVLHEPVVDLVLTFDHRWVNGVGAAAFLNDIRRRMEEFDLQHPEKEPSDSGRA
ncbi:MAG: thiamine pyrophosphate-dependent enzyme [Opitutales bacterium]